MKRGKEQILRAIVIKYSLFFGKDLGARQRQLDPGDTNPFSLEKGELIGTDVEPGSIEFGRTGRGKGGENNFFEKD